MNKLALLPILAALSLPAFAADGYLADQALRHSEIIKGEDPAASLLFERTVRIEQGQSNTTPLDVKAGQVYTVFADCAANCNNIGFSITQGRSTLFRKARGDGARFTWQAERDGRVELNTEMKDCNRNRCRSMVQVFAGGKVSNSDSAGTLPAAQQRNREQTRELDKDSRELPLISGSLADGQSRSVDLELTPGKYYTVFGNCDENCEDLDLTLLSDGIAIDADTDSDDVPALRFKVETGSRRQLKISMEDCDADTCAYSAQVFESSSNTDPSLLRAQRTNVEAVHNRDPEARVFLLRQRSLARGQSYTEQLNLTAGKVYTFFGDCDEQCSDIDLTLRLNGRIVKQDVLHDSVPLFSYRAPRSGSYSVTLPMKECSSSTCAASIHIFEGSKMVYDRQ
ncbi:hypothetical protein H9Q10_04405 [Eikenella sp. S3360]|uniref:Uncharacterized protein n=1 Tax=Eikenella glucosivorans TaxID=2766967 RepID=A0ABS0N9E8_9NEIS|nr:hypothetical protein [Eikenella glucosivorans]MBH5328907.1 hypothetical protein [Eikenella glucosivorans]